MLEFGFSAGGLSRDGKMESHVWHTNMVSLNRFWNMLYLTFHGLDRVKSLESLHSREVILTQRSYEFSADFWFDAGIHQSKAFKASYTGIYGNYMEHVLEMKNSCLLLLLICFSVWNAQLTKFLFLYSSFYIRIRHFAPTVHALGILGSITF